MAGGDGRKRWGALIGIGALTGVLCAAIVLVYRGGTPTAPFSLIALASMALGLIAAVLLGLGLTLLVLRGRRPKGSHQSET